MRSLGLLMLLGALVAVLFATGIVHRPESGRYPRYEHDHDELMVSDTPKATRTITVVFIGNSLTFHNDLPAMLVNLASSDPGNTTRFQVKGETFPNADLDQVRAKTGAVAWIQAHRTDCAILQDHTLWYDFGQVYDAVGAVAAWDEVLKSQGATPLLFQVWADGDKSGVYTNRDLPTFGSNPAEDTARSANQTSGVAKALGLQVVSVGDAFEAARETNGAPDILDTDHHHPSVAGTYLAALVFYRFFTGRSGEEATWRPAGLSAQDAAVLVRLNAD
jgi:hypothetical protein